LTDFSPFSRQLGFRICGHPLGNSLQEDQMQPRILRTPDAAHYLGLTASTLEKMRLSGRGPRFVRLGSRAVGYAIGDLDSFIDAGRRDSTSDPGTLSTPHRHGSTRRGRTPKAPTS
jgi:predicted DNA-binding transcriptional regulator AlpA